MANTMAPARGFYTNLGAASPAESLEPDKAPLDRSLMSSPPAFLGLRLLDESFTVLGPAPLLARLADLVPLVPVPTGARRVEVDGLDVRTQDGETVTAASESDLLGVLAAALNAAAVGSCQDVAVHAGVVAHGDRVAAFPAVSGSGKSTLTAACLQTGLAYVSDEALVLTDDARVRGYPKPLALDDVALGLLGLPPSGLPERLAARPPSWAARDRGRRRPAPRPRPAAGTRPRCLLR